MPVYWYDYLNNRNKDNLLNHVNVKDNSLIVCKQHKYRTYSYFHTYMDFLKERENYPPQERCFYEILLKGVNHKPYFDIDLTDMSVGDEIVVEMIEKMLTILPPSPEILVYTSHTEIKKSYHIVVNKYFLKSHEECKIFYDRVLALISEKYHPFIDSSVYKTVQQFRMLGSCKYEKKNIKVFSEELSYNLEIPKKYIKKPKGLAGYMFMISLIGNTVGCNYLEGYNVEEKYDNGMIPMGFSGGGDLEIVLEIFYQKYSYDLFRYSDYKDDFGNLIISFRRLAPSWCKECKRVHENENPFVAVRGMGRELIFYCRRGGGGESFGDLGPLIVEDIDVSEINIIGEGVSEPPSEEEMETYRPRIIEELFCLNIKEDSKRKGKITLVGLKF